MEEKDYVGAKSLAEWTIRNSTSENNAGNAREGHPDRRLLKIEHIFKPHNTTLNRRYLEWTITSSKERVLSQKPFGTRT